MLHILWTTGHRRLAPVAGCFLDGLPTVGEASYPNSSPTNRSKNLHRRSQRSQRDRVDRWTGLFIRDRRNATTTLEPGTLTWPSDLCDLCDLLFKFPSPRGVPQRE
jgi:hypothetical protein